MCFENKTACCSDRRITDRTIMDEIRKTRETRKKQEKTHENREKNTKTGKNPQAHLFKYHTNEYMKGPNRYEKRDMTINIFKGFKICVRAQEVQGYMYFWLKNLIFARCQIFPYFTYILHIFYRVYHNSLHLKSRREWT